MLQPVLIVTILQALWVGPTSRDDWEKRLDPHKPREAMKALREIVDKPRVAIRHLDILLSLVSSRPIRGDALRCLESLVLKDDEILRRVERALQSEADEVRAELWRPLGRAAAAGKTQTVAYLIDSLKSSEPVVVTTALRALEGTVKVLDESWPKVLELIQTPEVCVEAADVLLRSDFDAESVANAVRESSDVEPQVLSVMLILGREVSENLETMPCPEAIRECLRGEDAERQLIAMEFLLEFVEHIPEEWMEDIANGLNPSRRVLSSRAIELLIKVGPERWTEGIERRLSSLLRNRNPSLRAMGAVGLLAMGSEAKKALKTVEKALQHSKAEKRRQVLDDLLAVGFFRDDIATVILKSLHDEDEGVQARAIAWLEELGASGKVDDALRAVASDSSPSVSSRALGALLNRGSFGENDRSRMMTLLADPEISIPALFDSIPLDMSGDVVESAIQVGLESDDMLTRLAAAKAAVEMNVEIEKALDVLIEVASASLGGAAGFGGRFRRVSPLMMLRKAADDRHDGGYLKVEALGAIARLGSRAARVREAVEEALEDFDVEVRIAAKEALREIGK